MGNTMFVGLNELCNNLGLVLGVNNNGNPQKKPIKAVNRRFDRKNVTRKWTTTLSAELVSDLTLKDGTECVLDGIQTKKWRLKNNGNAEWGYNVELVYFKGNE